MLTGVTTNDHYEPPRSIQLTDYMDIQFLQEVASDWILRLFTCAITIVRPSVPVHGSDTQYQHVGLSSQSTYLRRGLQQIQPRPLASNRDELYRLSDPCANLITALKDLLEWGAGCNQCPGRNFAQFVQLKLMATLIKDYDIEQVDARKEWELKSQFTAIQSAWPCNI